jgi:hypothetical protein
MLYFPAISSHQLRGLLSALGSDSWKKNRERQFQSQHSFARAAERPVTTLFPIRRFFFEEGAVVHGAVKDRQLVSCGLQSSIIQVRRQQ